MLSGRIGLGASSKLGAELIGRALQFLLVYLAQRALGPATYGQFTFALAVGFVLAQLTDWGLQLTVTQQMTRKEADPASVAGAGLSMKLALALGAGTVLLLVTATRPPDVQAATFGLGLAMILGSFVEFFGYAFRGLQRVQCDAALTLFMRALTVTLGIFALHRGLGLGGLAAAYLIGSSTGAVAGYVWLRARFLTPRLTVAVRHWQGLMRPALPLGGAIFLSIAYTRTPVFLLDAMEGPQAVGVYGVAQRLTEPLAIIPAALMAAVFPAFVKARALGSVEAFQLRARTIVLLTGIGAVIASAGILGGPVLIDLLYGSQYVGSVVPLQILALALLMTFINYALTHFMIAQDLHEPYLLFTGTIFVLNLILCLLLIPRFGPTGAAVASLTSEAVLLAVCWRALPHVHQGDSHLLEPMLSRLE